MADITPITSQTSSTSGSDALQGIIDAVTNLNNDKLEKSLYDANSILYATTDNTPVALTVGASTIVGRKSSGDIVALTATETRTILNVENGATANSKATGAEVDTGTDDTKFLTVKAVNDSNNIPWVAPGTSGNVMTSNGTGWVSSAGTSFDMFFGDGSDGAGTISSDTTLTKDMYYTNLTVDSTFNLSTGGYRIYVSGTLTNNGTIRNNASGATGGATGSLVGGATGGAGANLGGGTVGGVGGGGGGIVWIAAKTIAVEGTIEALGAAGGNGTTGSDSGGATGSNGNSINATLISSGTGGNGGTGAGQAGGTGGTITTSSVSVASPLFLTLMFDFATVLALKGGASGGGGGAGRSGAVAGAGGGGGGQGGFIFKMYKVLTTSGTTTVTGGAGGTAATASGGTASNGTSGSSGRVLSLVIT